MLFPFNLVWTAFDQEGFGANLQHYNSLIDAQVAERYGITDDWQLQGQLVFGVPTGSTKEKTVKPLESRIVVRGSVPRQILSESLSNRIDITNRLCVG